LDTPLLSPRGRTTKLFDRFRGFRLQATYFAGKSIMDRAKCLLVKYLSCKSRARYCEAYRVIVRLTPCLLRSQCVLYYTPAQKLIYTVGGTGDQIRVAGTNLCIEFGPGLGANGRPLRVQNCRSNGAPGQRLILAGSPGEVHIRLAHGPDQCASVAGAGETTQLQSQRCASGDRNQVGELRQLPRTCMTNNLRYHSQIFDGIPNTQGVLSPYLGPSKCMQVVFNSSTLAPDQLPL
jgi:hypothetical protein